MLVGLLGNVVNMALAWSLIHGHFGLPALGVRGAGYATATTEMLELGALLFVVRRRAQVGPDDRGRPAALPRRGAARGGRAGRADGAALRAGEHGVHDLRRHPRDVRRGADGGAPNRA